MINDVNWLHTRILNNGGIRVLDKDRLFYQYVVQIILVVAAAKGVFG